MIQKYKKHTIYKMIILSFILITSHQIKPAENHLALSIYDFHEAVAPIGDEDITEDAYQQRISMIINIPKVLRVRYISDIKAHGCAIGWTPNHPNQFLLWSGLIG